MTRQKELEFQILHTVSLTHQIVWTSLLTMLSFEWGRYTTLYIHPILFPLDLRPYISAGKIRIYRCQVFYEMYVLVFDGNENSSAFSQVHWCVTNPCVYVWHKATSSTLNHYIHAIHSCGNSSPYSGETCHQTGVMVYNPCVTEAGHLCWQNTRLLITKASWRLRGRWAVHTLTLPDVGCQLRESLIFVGQIKEILPLTNFPDGKFIFYHTVAGIRVLEMQC